MLHGPLHLIVTVLKGGQPFSAESGPMGLAHTSLQVHIFALAPKREMRDLLL